MRERGTVACPTMGAGHALGLRGRPQPVRLPGEPVGDHAPADDGERPPPARGGRDDGPGDRRRRPADRLRRGDPVRDRDLRGDRVRAARRDPGRDARRRAATSGSPPSLARSRRASPPTSSSSTAGRTRTSPTCVGAGSSSRTALPSGRRRPARRPPAGSRCSACRAEGARNGIARCARPAARRSSAGSGLPLAASFIADKLPRRDRAGLVPARGPTIPAWTGTTRPRSSSR